MYEHVAYPAFGFCGTTHSAYGVYTGQINPSFLVPGYTYDQCYGVNLVDLAATWCMGGTRARMSNIRTIEPQDITGVSATGLQITTAGDMTISVLNGSDEVAHWQMPDTLVAPTLGIVNLLALCQILSSGYRATFTTKAIIIYREGDRSNPVGW